MRLIDASELYKRFVEEMTELVKSTNRENVDLEALSLLCGAKLISDAPNVTSEPSWISVKDRLPEEDVEVLVSNCLGIEVAAYTTNPTRR